MFTIFVVTKEYNRMYITTPAKLEKTLQKLRLDEKDVFWVQVSFEQLMFLDKHLEDYIRL